MLLFNMQAVALSAFPAFTHIALQSDGLSNYASKTMFNATSHEQEVAVKNAVFWDVTACGSCKKRLFRGTYHLHHQGDKNRRARNNVSSN
jgi:hypothetical protein